MNPDNFGKRLAAMVQQIGAHSAACIRMDNPLLKQCIEQNNELVADWLKAGLHGEMDYLERMLPDKADPWKTFPFAKSVIVLAFTNRWGDPVATHPFPVPRTDALVGYISAYAKEIDYHSAGKALLLKLKNELGEDVRTEAVVDTSAVYERLLATVGGLGVRGGNDLLRVPDRTNVRVFIGCLFVDAELPEIIHEPAMPFTCSDCRACIKKCPTGAIEFGKPIDARKCISYLTIEKKGILGRKEAEMVGDWLFGCDCCTVACPPCDKIDTRIPIDLEWLLKSPLSEIRRLIKNTAVSYAGTTRLRKNAVAILKISSSPLARELLDWVHTTSCSEQVINQLAAW